MNDFKDGLLEYQSAKLRKWFETNAVQSDLIQTKWENW